MAVMVLPSGENPEGLWNFEEGGGILNNSYSPFLSTL